MAEEPETKGKAPDDEHLLSLVSEERMAAIGFSQIGAQSAELTEARQLSLNYFKGFMPDIPFIENRSKAVSTDVAEAIETVMPDLMEIFVGGEDVATFQPVNPDDEEGARQETDYVNHVVLNENPGFLNFYSAFKDAVLVKLGVFKWWWEELEAERVEHFDDVDLQSFADAMAWAEQNGAEISDVEQDDEKGLVSYTLTLPPKGRVAISTVPPEDFAVARDTVELRNATYCSMRSRVRAQDLISDGYDPKKVEHLPAYANTQDTENLARDTAGEHKITVSSPQDLRLVEVVEHFIRIVDDKGAARLWRVVTGGQEKVLLEREEVDEIQFAAITPYPVPHRFFGRSIADLVVEVQRIKTALTRMVLDSGYFAMSQRFEVNMTDANEYTIGDLLQNEPLRPVRSKTGNALKPIVSPGLGFDGVSMLEYFSTVAESRTGVVRNAQGLNPDTLHDTAQGAQTLMLAAQKRVRMIARIFAETGVKDMFLGVHAMLRRHGTRQDTIRLRGKWVPVDPSQWGERKDMTIEIGVGSGGRQFALQQGAAAVAFLKEIIAMQGGTQGPLVTIQNAYNAGKRYLEGGLGYQSADPFLTDPSQQQQGPQQPPPPDPAMLKLQADQQMAQQKLDLEREKAAMDAQLRREQMQAEIALKERQMQAEIQLQRDQMEAEARLKAGEIVLGAHTSAISSPHVGGNVQLGGEVG